MNAQAKAQWIADLRSGQYKQGHGSLRKINHDGGEVFCAVGVLFDRADPTKWSKVFSLSEWSDYTVYRWTALVLTCGCGSIT